MFLKKFNRLTESEFVLLKGTDKMVNMITNKYYTEDYSIIEWLDEHSIGSFCIVKHQEGWILYMEMPEDVNNIRQYCQPEVIEAPAVHSINITDGTEY